MPPLIGKVTKLQVAWRSEQACAHAKLRHGPHRVRSFRPTIWYRPYGREGSEQFAPSLASCDEGRPKKRRGRTLAAGRELEDHSIAQSRPPRGIARYAPQLLTEIPARHHLLARLSVMRPPRSPNRQGLRPIDCWHSCSLCLCRSCQTKLNRRVHHTLVHRMDPPISQFEVWCASRPLMVVTSNAMLAGFLMCTPPGHGARGWS